MRALVPGLRNPVQGDMSPLIPYVPGFPVEPRYPGMQMGHLLREHGSGAPGAGSTAHWPSRRADVVIIGSGVAGLSCAWRLNRGGHRNFLMLQGPAPLGNASFGQHAFSAYPHGAHYLPLPSRRNMHVRHMLHAFGVLQDGLHDDRPTYDERAVVHAGMERVLHEGQWHEGLLPALTGAAQHQWDAVQAALEALGRSMDERQRAVFGTPLYAADMQGAGAGATLGLDRISFAQWLDEVGVRDDTLRWYFDYCCRDEYGAPAKAVSAWAGVHYFCAEHGKASNAQDGAVLTWPQGLGFLAGKLRGELTHDQQLPLSALRVRAGRSGGQEVLCLDEQGKPTVVRCDKVVVATPLFMARQLVPDHFDDLREQAGPQMSPWLVANFFMERFVVERPGEPLCWDNVISGSRSLGYVVATHQAIGQARPAGTVLTTYSPLGEERGALWDPSFVSVASGIREARRWAFTAGADELLAVATRDLDAAYGTAWRRWCTGAELTVHGHAMAVPMRGFLTEPVAQRARQALSRPGGIAFAHSDLSGYSVFEEASYWGDLAADWLLG